MNKPLYFLGIYTATETFSVSLCLDHQLIADRSVTISRDHSENFHKDVLATCQEGLSDLSLLAGIGVAIGPGGYTGLRIGTTIAKTIGYHLNCPVYSISTLEAIVYSFRSFEGLYLPTLPAKKGELNSALIGIHQKQINRLTADFSWPEASFIQKISKMEQPLYIPGILPNPIIDHVKEPVRWLGLPRVAESVALLAFAKAQTESPPALSTVKPVYSHFPTLGTIKKSPRL